MNPDDDGRRRLELARGRILRAPARGPLTAAELTNTCLNGRKDAVLAAERDTLLAEGLVESRVERFGYRQLPAETYRLTPEAVNAGKGGSR